jgi:DNA-binding NtrC family response regulator
MTWTRPERIHQAGQLLPPPLQAVRILLVEDERFVREVAAEILLSAGYNVLKARTGAEAMKTFLKSQEPLDLLITDVVLPGQNGYLLSHELVSICPGMKTIFMSGYPEKNLDESSLINAFYLAKPFSVDSLMRKVEQVLRSDTKAIERRTS